MADDLGALTASTTTTTSVQVAGGRPKRSALHVVLIAEAWTADHEVDFDQACASLWPELLKFAPFNLLQRQPDFLIVWSAFLPSQQQGPTFTNMSGSTVVGSTYDPASQTLTINAATATDLLSTIMVPTIEAPSSVGVDLQMAPSVVCFLVPPIANGTVISSECDSIVPSANSVLLPTPNWIACTTDDGWQRIVARRIARAAGLGDEWSDPGDAFDTPAPPNDVIAGFAVNLLTGPPPAGAPGPDFKWYSQMSSVAQSQPLTLVRPGGSTTAPIALVEGGGWFRHGIYRSAVDCFMARRIGDLGNSPRHADTPFCTICRRYLTMLIAGTTARSSSGLRLGKQSLLFDQVPKWDALTTLTTSSGSFIASATPAGSAPYWTFTSTFGNGNGLQITNLALQRLPGDSPALSPVADLIEFRDICVQFTDGSQANFDIAGALTSSAYPPVFTVATGGTVSPSESQVTDALKLSLYDEFGGKSPVELQLSFATRAPAADIEPSRSIMAAKFIPQLAVRWRPGGSVGVRRIRAAIRVVLHNAGNPAGMVDMPGMDMGNGEATVVSFFTDTNGYLDPLHRRLETIAGDIIPPSPRFFPQWAFVFDYHKPDFQTEIEIYAVNGPLITQARRQPRDTSVIWPPNTTYTLTTYREADQGAYDNVHVHANMGVDPWDPRTPKQPMVHAPGCAEACIHWHWRWGDASLIGSSLALEWNTPFKGWDRPSRWSPWASSSHGELGTPLIPPNQDLQVAVAHPDTTRADPWGPVITSPRAVDPARKAIWWTADVSNPARDEWQVIGEVGLSFAFDYVWTSFWQKATISYFRSLTGPLLGGQDNRTDAEVLHQMYSAIRWYLDKDDKATSEQIPQGTTIAANGSALESL